MCYLSNLPCGCTDEDVEVSFTGRPKSEEEAKECIREYLVEECCSADEITDEMVDEEFEENWCFVRYSSRNGGSGYVPY